MLLYSVQMSFSKCTWSSFKTNECVIKFVDMFVCINFFFITIKLSLFIALLSIICSMSRLQFDYSKIRQYWYVYNCWKQLCKTDRFPLRCSIAKTNHDGRECFFFFEERSGGQAEFNVYPIVYVRTRSRSRTSISTHKTARSGTACSKGLISTVAVCGINDHRQLLSGTYKIKHGIIIHVTN